MPTSNTEACIVTHNTVLLALCELEDEHERLRQQLCGTLATAAQLTSGSLELANKTVYLCGDVARASAPELAPVLAQAARVFVVEELSRGGDSLPWPRVELGRVPLLVHGVGVLYRRFFEAGLDHFEQIRREHAFQSLTESNKPAKAHRTGIYLTPVEREGEALHFRLLRCSSNFSGPTENFAAHDRHIVDALNEEAATVFEHAADLNHVLAQIYWNTPATATSKQKKAKIKGHADKTKDMPRNGIMAFCTFYTGLDAFQPLPDDPFDLGHKRGSALTSLHFRLKPALAEDPQCTLARQFSVTLYPNSVFFMPLSTNRLYTHEIRPGKLDAARLPTRLGYVVRCSARKAVHERARTFIELDEGLVELEPPTPEGMAELRKLYAQENRSENFIDYGEGFRFSMNAGDYEAPKYEW